MKPELLRLRVKDTLFVSVLWVASAFVGAMLLWLVLDVVRQGVGLLSWDYFTSVPRDAGRQGGISSVVVSTLAIVGLALLLVVPVSLASAVYLSEYANASARCLRFAIESLAGVPSIVFGLFGSAFFCVYLGFGFSIVSGALTLFCMMLPMLISTCESGLRALPQEWRRDAAALGVARSALAWQVLIPAAAPALGAGIMLALGRALAETAALIFTSGYVDRMPESGWDSGRSLAVHIYDLSMNVAGGDRAAYAAASALLVLVVLINVVANTLTHYWRRARHE
jgi:phosphate transport system permease protein